MKIGNKIETEYIKNLYINKENVDHNSGLLIESIKNIYYNGSEEEIKDYEIMHHYDNLIYKKDIKELENDDYNINQINQILRGYGKGILLSNINKSVSDSILRDIINNFEYTDIKLYDIYELLKNESTLDIELKIQELILEKINKDKNIKENELEK